MFESKRQLLTIGAFFIVLVVAILLGATNLVGWGQFFPLVLGLFGVWIIGLGAMRSAQPIKYERSGFSTVAMGGCVLVLGAAWYLTAYGWLYSLALVLLAVGLVAIAAALRRK